MRPCYSSNIFWLTFPANTVQVARDSPLVSCMCLEVQVQQVASCLKHSIQQLPAHAE